MKNFEKLFIGKGTKVNNLDIVRVSISREKLEEIMKSDMVNYDGNEFLVFEVAGLKQPDNYGRTHTAYISKKTESAPKESKARPKKAKQEEALPF
jgi:hypothetical protein